MTEQTVRLLTTGLIAERLKVRPSRVARILREHPEIRPAAMAGNARLYDREALSELRRIVNVQDARRAQRGGAQ